MAQPGAPRSAPKSDLSSLQGAKSGALEIWEPFVQRSLERLLEILVQIDLKKIKKFFLISKQGRTQVPGSQAFAWG